MAPSSALPACQPHKALRSITSRAQWLACWHAGPIEAAAMIAALAIGCRYA